MHARTALIAHAFSHLEHSPAVLEMPPLSDVVPALDARVARHHPRQEAHGDLFLSHLVVTGARARNRRASRLLPLSLFASGHASPVGCVAPTRRLLRGVSLRESLFNLILRDTLIDELECRARVARSERLIQVREDEVGRIHRRHGRHLLQLALDRRAKVAKRDVLRVVTERLFDSISYGQKTYEDVCRNEDSGNGQVAQGRQDLKRQEGEIDVGRVLKVDSIREG